MTDIVTMYELEIIGPKKDRRIVRLTEMEYFLGRDPSVQIQMIDRKVSRKHARIFFKDGHYWIEDLGSANGVILNGMLISSPTRIEANSRIEVGSFFVRVIDPSLAGAPVFRLIGLNKKVLKQVFPLHEGQIQVGRVDGNTIVIDDRSISRYHAKLTITTKGIKVEDQGSSNGCFINRQPIKTGIATHGQRIAFGSVEFAVEALHKPAPRIKSVGDVVHIFKNMDRVFLMALSTMLAAFFLLVLVAMVVIFGKSSESYAVDSARSVLAKIEFIIQEKLREGIQYQSARHWDMAISTYQQVLEKDPLNDEAKEGIQLCQKEKEHGNQIDRSQQFLNLGDSEKAYTTLSHIPNSSSYYDLAQNLLTQAKMGLAEKQYRSAQTSCSKNDLKTCHQHLIKHLSYNPSSTRGQHLLTEVEQKMRLKGIKFQPFSSIIGSGQDQMQFELNEDALASLSTKYPQAALREAVKMYVKGDLSGSIEMVNAYSSMPGASILYERLFAIQKLMGEAKSAMVNGKPEHAITAWENILTADREIIPADVSSQINTTTKRRLGTELYKLGETNFQRQLYTEAFNYWQKGSQIDDQNINIIRGFDKLEPIAEKYYRYGERQLGSSIPRACDTYQLVTTITRQKSQWYRLAKERIEQNCHGR